MPKNVPALKARELVEAKREMLAERVREARMNLEKGNVRTGTMKDLMEDLDRD